METLADSGQVSKSVADVDSSFLYAVGDTVLCFHGPILYEAKILKAELWDTREGHQGNGPHYLVHYKGWNEKWNEWVPEDRIRKDSKENRQQQENLNGLVQVIKMTKGEQSPSESHTTKRSISKKQGSGPGRRRTIKSSSSIHDLSGLDDDMSEQDSPSEEFKIVLPVSLKAILVDDWEHITRFNHLLNLPHRISVSKLLIDYQESVKQQVGPYRPMLQAICHGLKEYFDLAIGKLLLYTFERLQYKDLKAQSHPTKSMSDIYGPQHLLRLFVKLPSMMMTTQSNSMITEESRRVLKYHIDDLIQYMSDNSGTLFQYQDYTTASPEYIAQSSSIDS